MNKSKDFPTIFCATWVTCPYEGSEMVKYWWHPDKKSEAQFRGDIKKCLIAAFEAWLATNNDYLNYQWLRDITEGHEYWPRWLESDILEGRMANLGYRKCENFVFAQVPMDDPTSHSESEDWEPYLGSELYRQIRHRRNIVTLKEEAQLKAEIAKSEAKKQNEKPKTGR